MFRGAPVTDRLTVQTMNTVSEEKRLAAGRLTQTIGYMGKLHQVYEVSQHLLCAVSQKDQLI